jgi:hydroxyacylglutathione hydrolase
MAIEHLHHLGVERLILGPIETNTYILTTESGCAVIDPADDCSRIIRHLDGRIPDAIVLTHRHFDHIGALADLVERTESPAYAHELDADAIADPVMQADDFKDADELPVGMKVSQRLEEGDIIHAGDIDLEVIHTPGHTAGGISLLYRSASGEALALFSGDTLFKGAIGRTDLQTGDYRAIASSIHDKIAILPDGVRVYPGHGLTTTIGAERLVNRLMKH